MIYSRWRPDRGGYDYYETAERFGMGDDLPVPSLPGGTSIGVSSVRAGRAPRLQGAPVGSGAVARGMIVPTSRAGLEGLGVFNGFSSGLILVIGGAIGWVAARLWRRHA